MISIASEWLVVNDDGINPEETGHREDPMVSLHQAVLLRAINDITDFSCCDSEKIDAMRWLCDEENDMLQRCIASSGLDYEFILREVAKKGWNLNI